MLLGALFVLAAASGRVLLVDTPIADAIGRLSIGVLGVLLVSGGTAWLWWSNRRGEAALRASRYAITLEAPAEGQELRYGDIECRGAFAEAPPNGTAHVLTRDQWGTWYPNGEIVADPRTGRWSRKVQFDKAATRERYNIAVALVAVSDCKVLSYYYKLLDDGFQVPTPQLSNPIVCASANIWIR